MGGWVPLPVPHTYIDNTHTSTNAPLPIIVVSPRHSDKVELLGANTPTLRGVRTFLRAQFRKIGASTPDASGASTPGQTEGHCIVSVLHTRVGTANTGHKISDANPTQFKMDRTR